jgi:hypothetical protein
MTLNEFLLARIAEREAAAKACGDWYGYRLWEADFETIRSKGGYDIEWQAYQASESSAAFAAFVLQNQPGRVLAECKAHRQIVEMLEGLDRWLADYAHHAATVADEATVGVVRGSQLAAVAAVKVLASVHWDHDDYQPEWAVVSVPDERI